MTELNKKLNSDDTEKLNSQCSRSRIKKETTKMSKKRENKKKNAKLIEELNSKKNSASKSEIASKMQSQKQQTETTKERTVKDFVREHISDDAVDHSELATVRQRRVYRVSSTAKDNNTLYDATLYFNAQTEQLEFLTQKIADSLTLAYVEKLNSQEQFTAQHIMTLHRTCGGAYGDKVRNALYKISMRTTKDEFENSTQKVITDAVQKKKLCVFYDKNNDESKRKSYIFVKL